MVTTTHQNLNSSSSFFFLRLITLSSLINFVELSSSLLCVINTKFSLFQYWSCMRHREIIKFIFIIITLYIDEFFVWKDRRVWWKIVYVNEWRMIWRKVMSIIMNEWMGKERLRRLFIKYRPISFRMCHEYVN